MQSKSVSTSLHIPAGSDFWRAEFHHCRQSSAESTPVFIFTMLPAERLQALGRHLAMQGHPTAVATTGRFPWEITASKLIDIFDEVIAASPFAGQAPCLYGTGFDGLTVLLLASRLPRHRFSSLALCCASPCPDSSWLYRSGVLAGSALSEILACAGTRCSTAALGTTDSWQRGSSPFSFWPEREEWLLELCRQDGTFFRRRHELDSEALLKKCCGIPMLLYGSWHHVTAAGILRLSWHMAQSPLTPFRLHMTTDDLSMAEAYTPHAKITSLLRHWLKYRHSASKAHNYCYFMSETDGSGSWHCPSCWPPLNVVTRIWHLADTVLSPALQTDAASAPSTRFITGTPMTQRLRGEPLDFAPRPALNREGIPTAFSSGTAVFSMPPLTRPLEVLGIPRVVLWATCNRSDAAISARLTVQMPPRKCGKISPPLVISTGICRLALRCDTHLPLINDASELPVALDLELQPMARCIPAGAILRLEISSGEEPRFLPRLLSERNRGRRSEIAVWHTPRYPSRLLLPVLNKDPPFSAPPVQQDNAAR